MRNEKHDTIDVEDRSTQIPSPQVHSPLQGHNSGKSKPASNSDVSEHLVRDFALQVPQRTSSEAGLELARKAIEIAIEFKGLDVRGIDMQGVSDIADYFVIISGTSERHVKAISEKIRDQMPEKNNDINGYEAGEWILIDYGNLIVHVFYEPSRQHYAFDALWEKATDIELDDDLALAVRKLRTGLIRTA